MITVFRRLESSQPFVCEIGGRKYQGRKMRPFRVRRSECSSYLWPNALLIPLQKAVCGSDGVFAVIPGGSLVELCSAA